MEKQTWRGLLKNATRATIGGALVAQAAGAQAEAQTKSPVKKDATGKSQTAFPFTTVVAFGNLLFVSGIGCRVAGTIEEETKWVLDEIEKNLAAAGSSLEKVLKINIFLEDIKDVRSNERCLQNPQMGNRLSRAQYRPAGSPSHRRPRHRHRLHRLRLAFIKITGPFNRSSFRHQRICRFDRSNERLHRPLRSGETCFSTTDLIKPGAGAPHLASEIWVRRLLISLPTSP